MFGGVALVTLLTAIEWQMSGTHLAADPAASKHESCRCR